MHQMPGPRVGTRGGQERQLPWTQTNKGTKNRPCVTPILWYVSTVKEGGAILDACPGHWITLSLYCLHYTPYITPYTVLLYHPPIPHLRSIPSPVSPWYTELLHCTSLTLHPIFVPLFHSHLSSYYKPHHHHTECFLFGAMGNIRVPC